MGCRAIIGTAIGRATKNVLRAARARFDGRRRQWPCSCARYSQDAASAAHIGPKNEAHPIHCLAVRGSRTSSVALTAAATSSAQPANAFAGYQIALLDNVTVFLKP